jgi:hypothetical protein
LQHERPARPIDVIAQAIGDVRDARSGEPLNARRRKIETAVVVCDDRVSSDGASQLVDGIHAAWYD